MLFVTQVYRFPTFPLMRFFTWVQLKYKDYKGSHFLLYIENISTPPLIYQHVNLWRQWWWRMKIISGHGRNGERGDKTITGVISPGDMFKALVHNGDTFTPRAGETAHMRFWKTIHKGKLCIKVLFCSKLKLGIGWGLMQRAETEDQYDK